MMIRRFHADDIRRAKEVHFYNERTLYVVDDDDEAYGFHREGGDWFYKSNFWDYFESEIMLSFFTPITKDEAAEMYASWCKQTEREYCCVSDARYYLDAEAEVLHLIGGAGEHFCLCRSLPEFWDPYELFLTQTASVRFSQGIERGNGERYFYRSDFSLDGLSEISKRDAETLEDEWCRDFTICG